MPETNRNRVALITGASKGIGKSIAEHFAAAGYHVGMIARSEALLAKLHQELESHGIQAAYASCDLLDPAATEQSVSTLVDILGTPGVVVNNAGIVFRQAFAETSLEDCEAVMRLNVLAPMQITAQLLPLMRAEKSGRLLFVSSISGRVPLPGGSVYAASKFALTGFADSLLNEVRDDGIQVCTLFPGSVARESEEARWKLTPDDVARAALFAAQQPAHCCVHHLEVRPLRRAANQ